MSRGGQVDKFTYLFSEEKRLFMQKLFTVIFAPEAIPIGSFRR